MIRISVWNHDLSDSYMRQVTQLGADCIDFGSGDAFPGTREQGYPDLDQVREIKKRIRTWGLDINRVTLPNISEKFIESLPDGEQELENACRALEVFGQAKIPVARQRFVVGPGGITAHRVGSVVQGHRPRFHVGGLP